MSREQYERGTILEILRSNRGVEMPIAFFQLLRTMHLMNLPLSPQALREQLEYLAQKNFLEVTRRDQMPGYRVKGLKSEERPEHIVMVKLTARALDLLEGTISEPGVFV